MISSVLELSASRPVTQPSFVGQGFNPAVKVAAAAAASEGERGKPFRPAGPGSPVVQTSATHLGVANA